MSRKNFENSRTNAKKEIIHHFYNEIVWVFCAHSGMGEDVVLRKEICEKAYMIEKQKTVITSSLFSFGLRTSEHIWGVLNCTSYPLPFTP